MLAAVLRCRSVRVGPVARTTAAALFVALLAPAAAGAHLRTGTVAVGYGASVRTPSRTAGAAYTVGVYQSDRALHLTVSRGHAVVVIGYLGEPLLRIGPAGVAVNLRSPTAAAAGLLPKAGRTSPSNSGWRLERGMRSVVWHDPRDQRLPRGMARASWSVPIVVDGRRAHISGELWRVPRPTPWPWLLIAAVFAVLGGAVGLRGDERRLRAGCIVLGVVSAAAAIIAAAAFAIEHVRLTRNLDCGSRRVGVRRCWLRRAGRRAARCTRSSRNRPRPARPCRRPEQGRGIPLRDRAGLVARDRDSAGRSPRDRRRHHRPSARRPLLRSGTQRGRESAASVLSALIQPDVFALSDPECGRGVPQPEDEAHNAETRRDAKRPLAR